MINNKKILLTGGCGFIGSKLCDSLSKDNEILIYDNLKRNAIKNTTLLSKNNINLIEGDILDYSFLKKIINDFKPNIVIHLAAIAGIDTVIKNPVNTMKVNMIGTYNLLECLKDNICNIERFIDFSTSEVFGSYAYKVNEKCTTNISPVGETRWTYSVSKLAGEHLTYSYYKEYGLPAVSVRPFNIYGPGQVGESAIHKFVINALNNKEIQIYGDGSQIRSWCYINDFVNAIMLCVEKEKAIGNSFNLGNSTDIITVSMLAQLIKKLSHSSSNIVYLPKNHVDVELRIPNIDKARKILNYNPKYDLEKGLTETIAWYRSQEND